MSDSVFWIYASSQKVLALVVPGSYKSQNINFLTPNSFGQQIAYMSRPQGEIIQAHIHEPVQRNLIGTQEVLLIRSGRIRVDFYESDQSYVCSYVLEAGDLMLLNEGGHGFEILEDTDMIEIKQGPYMANKDKTRFTPKLHELVMETGNIDQ